MESETVSSQLRAADTSDWDEVWSRWRHGPLRPLAAEALPLIVAAYSETTHWQARAAQLYYATGFSRTRSELVAFATQALSDKSIEVRYRACGLLAFAHRRRAIPKFEEILPGADAATARYILAAIEAIEQKSIEPFTALDTPARNFYHLPVRLPCRCRRSTFAEEFDRACWGWLRRSGFEQQFVFQHDAYYRKGDIWFHAYWEQWDLLWDFMLGKREQLEGCHIGAEVPQPMSGGTLKDVSKFLAAEVTARLQELER